MGAVYSEVNSKNEIKKELYFLVSVFFSSSRTFLSSRHSQRGTVRRRSPRASLVCEFVLENSLCSGLLAGTPSRSGSSLANLLTNLICLFEVYLVQFRQWTISPSRVHKQRVRSGKLPCRLLPSQ